MVLGNHYGGSGLIIGKKLQLQALREGNQFEEYLLLLYMGLIEEQDNVKQEHEQQGCLQPEQEFGNMNKCVRNK